MTGPTNYSQTARVIEYLARENLEGRLPGNIDGQSAIIEVAGLLADRLDALEATASEHGENA